MRRHFLIPAICIGLIASAYSESPGDPIIRDEEPTLEFHDTAKDSGLTWEQVDSLVVADNLVLNAAKQEVEGSRAGLLQAGAYPNPALSAQFENFAGTGQYQGTRGLETTFSLNQPIETGGKRKLRHDLAAHELKLAELEYRSRHAGLILKARSLFWDILLAQETLLLEKEDRRTATAFLEVQALRRKAGKSPLLEEERARTSLLNTELKLRRVEREASALRSRLAMLMSRDTTAFYRVRGNLSELEPMRSFDSLNLALQGSQAKVRSGQVMQLRQGEFALEKAKAWPDVELEAGWRHSSDISAHAVVAGLRLPLPMWDRNRGSILRAQTRISQARMEIQIAEGSSKTLLKEQYRRLLALRSDVVFIRDSLLPSASASFQSAQEGFQLGRFSPLEILDARRTYLEARQTYLETLAEYHHLSLDMERLMTLGFMDGVEGNQEAVK